MVTQILYTVEGLQWGRLSLEAEGMGLLWHRTKGRELQWGRLSLEAEGVRKASGGGY